MRLLASIILLLVLIGCQSNGSSDTTSSAATAGSASVKTTGGSVTGEVIETMNAGGYTYVQVDTGGEKIWAAGPQQSMETGATVTIDKGMPMPGFSSETLDRTFDTLYFVSGFGPGEMAAQGESTGSADAHAGAVTSAAPASIDLTGIEIADHTVASLYAEKGSLAGESVRVRGKVVKALSGIMGSNWLHIQDGTGEAETSDLTVTTDQIADVGATVVVEGVLVVDRDFGSGYKYAVLIENAAVTVE